MSADSNFYRGMQIGMAETTGAGYPFAEHFVENIRKVTSADIQRVARIYLTDDNKSIGILIPKTQITETTSLRRCLRRLSSSNWGWIILKSIRSLFAP